MGTCKISHTQKGMLTCVVNVPVLFRWSYCYNFLSEASFHRYKVLSYSSWSSDSYNLSMPLFEVFWPPSFRVWVVERSIWGWAPIYQLFSIIENRWISMRVSVCHKKKLLWSATHICGYKDRYLQWRLELGRYRKVIVVVFPLRSMTLPNHW